MESKALHLIVVQPVSEDPTLSGREVKHLEQRTVAVAACERDAASVGHQHGTDGAPVAADLDAELSGFSVEPHDPPEACQGVRVVAEATRPTGEPEVVPVRCHLACVRMSVLRREGEAIAAVEMVLPELCHADAARVDRSASSQQPRSIGVPDRIGDAGILFLGDLFGVVAVGVHDPQLLIAAGVRDVGEAAAVGREAGLRVPCRTLGESGCFAPLEGNLPQVAQ